MKKVRYHDRVKNIIDEIMKILCSMHATKYHVSERENPMNFHLVCYYLFINNHAKKAFIICLYHTRMPTFYAAAATHPMSSKSMAIFSLFIPLILAATNEFFTFTRTYNDDNGSWVHGKRTFGFHCCCIFDVILLNERILIRVQLLRNR